MDPLDLLFAALLGVGALAFLRVQFALPPYYMVIPRSAARVARAMYMAIAVGYLTAAYFVLREPHAARRISAILLCTTLLTLIAIGLERFWLWRDRRGSNARD